MDPKPLLLKGHRSHILGISWSNDSKKILTCSTDKNVILWDVSAQNPIKAFQNDDICSCVKFLPKVNSTYLLFPYSSIKNNHFFVTGSFNKLISIRSLETGGIIDQVQGGDIITCISFSEFANIIAVGFYKSVCKIYKIGVRHFYLLSKS